MLNEWSCVNSATQQLPRFFLPFPRRRERSYRYRLKAQSRSVVGWLRSIRVMVCSSKGRGVFRFPSYIFIFFHFCPFLSSTLSLHCKFLVGKLSCTFHCLARLLLAKSAIDRWAAASPDRSWTILPLIFPSSPHFLPQSSPDRFYCLVRILNMPTEFTTVRCLPSVLCSPH